MKKLSLLLLFVLAGCSNQTPLAPTSSLSQTQPAAITSAGTSGPIIDPNGPPTDPNPPPPGTCAWRDRWVTAFLAGSQPPFYDGKVPGFYPVFSSTLWVFLEDRPSILYVDGQPVWRPYSVTDYPAPWCVHGA